MNIWLLLLLAILLVICSINIVRVRELLTLVILTSIFSGIISLIYAVLGAVDVAFTESVVGASISTIFFMMLVGRLKTDRLARPRHNRLMAKLVTLATGAVLLYAITVLPNFGTGDAPIQTAVAPAYIEGAEPLMHTPNVVTAVLADYRSFDTLIETTVVLTAALVCLLIMCPPRVERGTARDKSV